MDGGDKALQPSDSSNPKEEQASVVVKSVEGAPVEDEEVEYMPDDGENSIDDEATLEEQEALENDADIADEVAALQEEQDIPVEELMRLYGYNNTVGATGSTSAAKPSAVKATDQHSQNTDSFSSPSSSSPCEPCTTTISRHCHNFVAYGGGGNGNDMGEDEDEDQEGGASREHGYFSTSDEDSENDYDYVPEEAWRKDIKVGPEYQADVPASTMSPTEDIDSGIEADDCMWFPNVALLNDGAVEAYLKLAIQTQRAVQIESKQLDVVGGLAESTDGGAPVAQGGLKRKIESLYPEGDGDQQPVVPVRDDETALKLLYESQYDIDQALVAWKRSVLERKQRELTPENPDRPWTEDEQTAFEEGLKVHGKNFRLIQQEFLPNRTTRDLVRYYYLWKRTERHDVFVQTYRFEKRQCSLHPNASDYMDHFLDHMALVGATSSVAASAFQTTENPQGVHAALHQTNHHAYLSLLPSNTNARHHLFLGQSQKGDSEGVVVAEELNPVSGEGGEVNNHSPREYAL